VAQFLGWKVRPMSIDNEAECRFWKELEFRVSREMRKPSFKKLFLWCDGFAPEQYFLNETPARIIGSAWIGDRQEVWKFTLSLPPEASSGQNIDWAQLLPASDAGGWLFIAPAKKELEVRLA
jgi:hypothetical protein